MASLFICPACRDALIWSALVDDCRAFQISEMPSGLLFGVILDINADRSCRKHCLPGTSTPNKSAGRQDCFRVADNLGITE